MASERQLNMSAAPNEEGNDEEPDDCELQRVRPRHVPAIRERCLQEPRPNRGNHQSTDDQGDCRTHQDEHDNSKTTQSFHCTTPSMVYEMLATAIGRLPSPSLEYSALHVYTLVSTIQINVERRIRWEDSNLGNHFT